MQRYRVDYITTSGQDGCFGETNEPDGGMPFASAKLLPWVASATLIDQRTETLLRAFHRTVEKPLALRASA